MKLAIVGTGVSGLVCAHHLHGQHDVVIFEAADRIGGHSNTVRVELEDESHDIDTGFIVYNERNYPRFTRLLEQLDVRTQPSEMSFSVRNERTGHEWSGSSLDGVFARRRSLIDTSHWRMLAEILRFNRMARRHLSAVEPLCDDEIGPTLGDLLAEHRFHGRVVEDYIIPLGSAIWSADPHTFGRYPARSLFRFLDNHGLITLGGRPAWRTVSGGSINYVSKLVAPFRDRIRLADPVEAIVRRAGGGVEILTRRGERVAADAVILACHSDEALDLLDDPSDVEREVLGSIRYQQNVATLHTGESMLPRSRRAWSSWNYHVTADERNLPTVTYWMNRLQGVESSQTICVTLNRHDEIDPARVMGRFTYAHPVYDPDALRAQRRRHEIQGTHDTWFVGAYWGNGFHEDGVASADEVVAALAPARTATVGVSGGQEHR